MNEKPVDPKKQDTLTGHVVLHKDQMSKLKVGEPASIKMKGTVKSISPHVWDDPKPEHFKVELGDIEAEHAAEDQESLSTMPKEQLKKRITRPE